MSQQDFIFTLWDVGHGMCIWIQTPNAHNHWIDCGKTDEFSPSEHVQKAYGVSKIHYLIISHPDIDHIGDLPSLVKALGQPATLFRNKTLPDAEKFQSGTLECQAVFKALDTIYTKTAEWNESPRNPELNGGVEIKADYNAYSDDTKGNNTSVVVLYHYAGWLFVCPGDIEDAGWIKLWASAQSEFAPLISKSKWRVLIAPHHGRPSGYSQAMMDNVNPHVAIVSDIAGQSGTDRRFRENPRGLSLIVRPKSEEEVVKWLSTKRGGRVQFEISSDGSYHLHQYEYW